MENDDLMNMNSKKNIKKPIIYGAVAFLVFIIGVIGYAIYANSTNKNNVVLPPQVDEKSVKNDFKQIKIENNVSNNISNNKINKNEILNNTKKENTNIVNNQKKSESVETQSKNIEPKKAVIVEKTESKKVIENKKIKPRIEKPIKAKKIEEKKSKVISNNKYYIQVAALVKYKKPNKKFLELIKKEGFSYTFYHTYIVRNSQKILITKILVGPFPNRSIARKNLIIIKDKLTQNAFIFRMK